MSKYAFSKKSMERLTTCHPDLIRLMLRVIEISSFDITILEGVRPKELQDRYFAEGKSKLQWPKSKHNILNVGDVSMAVDIAPFIPDIAGGPIPWNDSRPWFKLAGFVEGTANAMGIKIRWGGDWDGDMATENKFNDYPHFELV